MLSDTVCAPTTPNGGWPTARSARRVERRCAAARIAHAGLRTLVVDDKDRPGGRASTEEIDGFKVNIGAIAIELGGVFEETFRTVGAPHDIRAP